MVAQGMKETAKFKPSLGMVLAPPCQFVELLELQNTVATSRPSLSCPYPLLLFSSCAQ